MHRRGSRALAPPAIGASPGVPGSGPKSALPVLVRHSADDLHSLRGGGSAVLKPRLPGTAESAHSADTGFVTSPATRWSPSGSLPASEEWPGRIWPRSQVFSEDPARIDGLMRGPGPGALYGAVWERVRPWSFAQRSRPFRRLRSEALADGRTVTAIKPSLGGDDHEPSPGPTDVPEPGPLADPAHGR